MTPTKFSELLIEEREMMIKTVLVYCSYCQKKHKMSTQPCPQCMGRGGDVLMPASERVYDVCRNNYVCAGCEAYNDHYR